MEGIRLGEETYNINSPFKYFYNQLCIINTYIHYEVSL